MRFKILIISIFSFLLGNSQSLTELSDYVKTQNCNSVDYIFSLFEKYDYVILAERDHSEFTQYEFITDILKDKRFTNNIGNLFTEIGVSNMKDSLNLFLSNAYNFSDSLAANNKLIQLYRDIDYYLIWEKYNYYYLLKSIYEINKTVEKQKQIKYFPSNIAFPWDTVLTKNQYQTFHRNLINPWYRRDSIMAQNIINELIRIKKDSSIQRKKALIILNAPHSFMFHYRNEDSTRINKRTAYYLKQKFKRKVASVLVNAVIDNSDGDNCFIYKGLWDAAFEINNNKSIGFNLKGTPFGNTRFDMMPYNYPNYPSLKYSDAFTGFVFYKAFYKHQLVIGIPNLIDSTFYKEIERREKISSSFSNIESTMSYYNNKRSFEYDDIKKLKRKMKKIVRKYRKK